MTDPDRGLAGWTMALAALAAAPVQIVIATEYLSVEGAQKALFPQADCSASSSCHSARRSESRCRGSRDRSPAPQPARLEGDAGGRARRLRVCR